MMISTTSFFLSKALESLAGAESEYVSARYNNCANRCYYACFQAAIYALMGAGIQPPGSSAAWSHAFVPARFDGLLINRRKLYPANLRGVLARNYDLRRRADYANDLVTQTEANRALRRTEAFVHAVQAGGGEIR